MKLSDVMISAVRETYGEYDPEKHDKLVQNLVKKVSATGQLQQEVSLRDSVTRMLLGIIKSKDVHDSFSKIVFVLCSELARVIIGYEKIMGIKDSSFRKIPHEFLDKIIDTYKSA